MRQQPMLVTALALFVTLITVLRPSPMVDRDQNGVADTEQAIVFADGYVYAHASILPSGNDDIVLAGTDTLQPTEPVGEDWVRTEIPTPGTRFNFRMKGVKDVSDDFTTWARLDHIKENPNVWIGSDGTLSVIAQ